ncbi:MAG: hypothetical protein ACEPOZ_18775 [Marinifilaceae bacterium]
MEKELFLVVQGLWALDGAFDLTVVNFRKLDVSFWLPEANFRLPDANLACMDNNFSIPDGAILQPDTKLVATDKSFNRKVPIEYRSRNTSAYSK